MLHVNYISPPPQKKDGEEDGEISPVQLTFFQVSTTSPPPLWLSPCSLMSSGSFGHFVNNLLVVICESIGPKVATRSLSEDNSIIILILNTISKSEILNTLNKKVNRTATPKKELRDSVPYFPDPGKCPKKAIQGLRDDPDVLRLLRHWICGCFYFFSLFSML